jgi:uncharacterized protein with HEPN domain
MDRRTLSRLTDILAAIEQIDGLLAGKSPEDLYADRVVKAALERFLEIISEASRHIPDNLKLDAPAIPWRRIADLGNHIRHAYHAVDADILWKLYARGELAALKAAVEGFVYRQNG